MSAKPQASLKPKTSRWVRLFGFALLVAWLTLAWIWARSINHSIRLGAEVGGVVYRMNTIWGITRFEAADLSDLSDSRFRLISESWAWGPAGIGEFLRISATLPRISRLESTNSHGFEMGTAWVATLLIAPTLYYMHLKQKNTPGGENRVELVCPKCGAKLRAAGQACPVCVAKNPDESDSSGQRLSKANNPSFGVSK